MQPLFEHRLRLAGFQTRALELEGDGPPLVLLHGYADSADTWRPALALLGARDRRAIAFDLPGFGTADPLYDVLVLPQFGAFAAAAVRYASREAGGAPVVLAGNSLGGCIALRAAEDPALPLAGIVPVAPAGLDMARWFTLIERDRLITSLLAVPVPLPEPAVREVVGRVYRALAFSRSARIDAKAVHAFTSHFRDRATVRRYLATGRRLLSELEDPFRLERIEVPVMVVWGTRDVMVAHSGAKRISAALPGAQVQLIDGCGHCPQIEQAERFTELLCDFAEPLAQAVA